MRPLDPLPALEDLLRRALPLAVRAELARLDALALDAPSRAARSYGHGAFAIREGRFMVAQGKFECAAEEFAHASEAEAAELAMVEAWLGRVRLGGKAALDGGAGVGYQAAIDAFEGFAREASTRRVRVVATHYLGTALRHAGRAEETQATLLRALADSEGLLPERAQILNSLGTLYVLLGAHGAARSLLEHAADLAKRLKDAMGEAIACGQLGSAALAQGEPDAARRFLLRQEWLSESIGDTFGRARALVFLAEISLDRGRPDEARELATRARDLALSVEPPLTMWLAHATRLRGRARLELGDAAALDDLECAQREFRILGNKLGCALVTWDGARHGEVEGWAKAAWELASLGLAPRVATLLLEHRQRVSGDEPLYLDALDSAIAATAQTVAHVAAAHEIELLYKQPLALAAMSARRLGGQRNTSRLAALVLAPPGLYVAVLVHPELGGAVSAMPPATGDAVCLGATPALAVWCWRGDASAAVVARDLATVRAERADVRVALGWSLEARVCSVPLSGESVAGVSGVAVHELMVNAFGAKAGALVRELHVPWDDGATVAWGQA